MAFEIDYKGGQETGGTHDQAGPVRLRGTTPQTHRVATQCALAR